MKYLQKYQQYNESWKTNMAKAGLLGTLLLHSPEVEVGTVTTTPVETTQQQNEKNKLESQILELSKQRQKISQDQEFNQILKEIQDNLHSQDSAKFVELFNRLNNHLSEKYNFQITQQSIPTEVTMTATDFDFNLLIGWIGSILLAVCGLPQAWMSYKDKNSDGISWAFLLLWGFGELFCLGYVYKNLDLPLLVNYGINILIIGTMIYYKINPTRKEDIKPYEL